MWKFKEFKDYDVGTNMSAIDQLEIHCEKYKNTEVVGYTVNHFENLNNKERTYILVKYLV
ncbi:MULTISPECIES: hypothetical protein [Staphylococcus]|mgnify:FL=1|jgi:hypothetical protein|uniref:Uncharacterized protein n=1 Tax=Staphylococcus phage HS13 TaxID=3056403 RepID=A0AA49X3V9_9VIRU|nr:MULTISPECIES: hypothetical protein [Staphylococcus]URG13527.1 hypothetical protein CUBEPI14_gp52 [Staphylococcus phage CUB-EPI_14]UVD33295.1 hypothetical protein [Staphylococcus phage Lacachita]WGL30833.1 hypothetical protein Southeast_054 [Staphylococcus phage Southeast]WLJ26054.1 MAG: hypothetical protein [Staphylococcus phage HS13]WNM55300.1 hypothetical protein CoNPh27_CDS0034 [Staphylococcus phage S-CoN_Ph27]DAI53244.1 MAG TPA: hypothetical protein [Caudoviricetes sp.]